MSEVRNDPTAADRMRRHRARLKGEDNWTTTPRKPGPKPKRRPTMISASPARGYALDFISPVRHAATELEKAGTRGATVAEMTATYTQAIPGDLTRVCLWHGLKSQYEARRLLIDRAVAALWAQDYLKHARRAGAYRLAVPFGDLRVDGSPVARESAS
jgi:hypothetical protein